MKEKINQKKNKIVGKKFTCVTVIAKVKPFFYCARDTVVGLELVVVILSCGCGYPRFVYLANLIIVALFYLCNGLCDKTKSISILDRSILTFRMRRDISVSPV